MKSLSEYLDLKEIRKIQRDYYDTLDEEVEEHLDKKIERFGIKYNKEYFIE